VQEEEVAQIAVAETRLAQAMDSSVGIRPQDVVGFRIPVTLQPEKTGYLWPKRHLAFLTLRVHADEAIIEVNVTPASFAEFATPDAGGCDERDESADIGFFWGGSERRKNLMDLTDAWDGTTADEAAGNSCLLLVHVLLLVDRCR
jgi:hypothetical protein